MSEGEEDYIIVNSDEHETDHALWDYFIDWVDEEGEINLEHKEDWFPWWQCFLTGAIAHIRKNSSSEPTGYLDVQV